MKGTGGGVGVRGGQGRSQHGEKGYMAYRKMSKREDGGKKGKGRWTFAHNKG